MFKAKIADLIVKFEIPDTFTIGDIHKFYCDDTLPENVKITLKSGKAPAEMLNTPPHTVLKIGGKNIYTISAEESLTHFEFDEKYSQFFINIDENINIKNLSARELLFIESALNAVLRRIFIIITAAKNGICLHASTISINREAICFSAPSGVGKTTHTNLWRENINGVSILNGDMCYIFNKNDKSKYYSAPWSGTSGDCINQTAPLNAIVFLQQGSENIIRKLDIAEAFIRLCARCFLPAWDKNIYQNAIEAAEITARNTDCYHLLCRPDKNAAEVCYSAIIGGKN